MSGASSSLVAQDAVLAVLAAHGLAAARSEVLDAMSEEHVGSALDVHEALAPVLMDAMSLANLERLSRELFAVLSASVSEGEAKRRRVDRDITSYASAGAASSAASAHFLDACAWKREYMSERQRFHEPYTHVLTKSDTTLKAQC